MKKYLPLILGTVVVGLFWWFSQGGSSGDATLKNYEAKVNRLLPIFVSDIGTSVPAEDIYAIILLGYLDKIAGVDYTVQEPLTEEGQLNSWYAHEDRYDEVPEINCFNYTGPTVLRCFQIYLRKGASVEYLYDEVSKFEPQTYEEIFRKLLLEKVLLNKKTSEEVRRNLCETFTEIYEVEEPEDLCATLYRAKLSWYCLSSDADYQMIVEKEPQTVADFTCYYLSYLDYKERVLGIV